MPTCFSLLERTGSTRKIPTEEETFMARPRNGAIGDGKMSHGIAYLFAATGHLVGI
jgi:hypothetical protein